MTLRSLLDAGYVAEAAAWRECLLRAIAGYPADLQIMYGLHGSQNTSCLAQRLRGILIGPGRQRRRRPAAARRLG